MTWQDSCGEARHKKVFRKVCNSRLKVEELSNSIVLNFFLISILHISYHKSRNGSRFVIVANLLPLLKMGKD